MLENVLSEMFVRRNRWHELKERIDEVYKELLAGKNFEELSETHDDVKLIEEKERKLSTALPYIGSKNPQLLGLIASSEPVELLNRLKGSEAGSSYDMILKVKLTKRSGWFRKILFVMNSLINRQNEAVNAYITELTDNADIVDNRRYHIR
jgi:hypothetical protein